MDTDNNEVVAIKKVGRPAKKNISKEEERIAELERQINFLAKQIKNKNDNEIENYEVEDDNVKISSDDYIKVMSMLPYTLNLNTKLPGKGGDTFTFEKFGEVKKILYSDLAKILEYNRNMARNGSFIILDKRVVRRHGLDEAYEKILTKDNIEKILDGNESDAVRLFKTANKSQQEVICQMIIQNGIDGKEYDLNLLMAGATSGCLSQNSQTSAYVTGMSGRAVLT